MSNTIFERAYPLAVRAAQVRSAAAVATSGVPVHDREDLEQEMVLGVWRALPRYDPSRASLRTFIERVIANRFASLLRARRRQLKVESFEGQNLGTRDGIPALEFRTDVQRVVGSLAERDRRLVLRMMAHSPTEASRSLGISRSTVYARIRRIRFVFQEAGLGPRGVVQ